MFDVDFSIQNERIKDLQRDADNVRLARKAREQRNVLQNVRHALGRSLVQAGEQLLNER